MLLQWRWYLDGYSDVAGHDLCLLMQTQKLLISTKWQRKLCAVASQYIIPGYLNWRRWGLCFDEAVVHHHQSYRSGEWQSRTGPQTLEISQHTDTVHRLPARINLPSVHPVVRHRLIQHVNLSLTLSPSASQCLTLATAADLIRITAEMTDHF